jgi:hypothetical protein
MKLLRFMGPLLTNSAMDHVLNTALLTDETVPVLFTQLDETIGLVTAARLVQ